MTQLLKIDPSNSYLISSFLERAGSSLLTFRYFNTRPLSAINNHIVTYILMQDASPIGYGHLDKDGETVWLGICVIEQCVNKGLGQLIMRGLLQEANRLELKSVRLTVDKHNIGAIKLYQRFGFSEIEEKSNYKIFEHLL